MTRSRFSLLRASTLSMVVIAIVLILIEVDPAGFAFGQRRRPTRRTQRRPATSAIDYSKFSHATEKHRGSCDSCHKIPSPNYQKVRNFPDITDYPDHDACVSCHRPQFFRGAKPPICSVCHSKVSPRDDARFPFRKPGSLTSFLIEFPHDRHQDVIAQRLRSDRKEVRFVPALFAQETPRYNNCEICHQSRTASPTTAGPDNFVADAGTFKASPNNHASCFNCHWKSQQPINSNCGGCHKLSSSPVAMIDSPVRISMKFRHAREQHIAECTTCHINITKSESLRGLKPDVPITSCTECHNKDGLRLDVSKELETIDKNKNFTCTYCHTSDVGRRDPPASHYLIAGRPPLKRADIK